jgi:5-methylcytosine-specific restriction endonuclease McrA
MDPAYRAKQAEWWARNRRKRYEYVWRRRAKLYGLDGAQMSLDIRDWDRLVARHRGLCAYCSCPMKVIHMDHIIPVSRGGLHRIGNVLPVCKSCNSKKRNRLLIEWRAEKGVGN